MAYKALAWDHWKARFLAQYIWMSDLEECFCEWAKEVTRIANIQIPEDYYIEPERKLCL